MQVVNVFFSFPSFFPDGSSGGPPVEMIPTSAIMSDISKGNFVGLSCRSIRVGSYKSMSKDKAVFTHTGIHVKVPDIIDRKSFFFKLTKDLFSKDVLFSQQQKRW